MKNALLIIACLLVNSLSAQLKLSVHNIAPRVGDEIWVTLTFPETAVNSDGSAELKTDIKISSLITQTGNVWVGPFTFKVGNNTLTTDSVMVQVADKLTNDKEDFLVRQITYNGKEYLVVEEFNKKNKFAKLKTGSVNNGISLKETSSTAISSKGKGGLPFKVTVYEIKKESGYEGAAIITAQNFSDFPENIPFEGYTIQ